MPKTKKKKVIGATLAATAALSFAAVPISSALADTTTKGKECFGVDACQYKDSMMKHSADDDRQ